MKSKLTPVERHAETERVKQFLDLFAAGSFHVGRLLTVDDISLLTAVALRLQREQAEEGE
jgi:hypothetical protein